MQAVRTVGLDIAKSIFQAHGVAAAGNVLIRRQIRRRYVLAFFQKLPPCVVRIEVCATSHYWSRQLQAIRHTVRLMPPAINRRRFGDDGSSQVDPKPSLTPGPGEAFAQNRWLEVVPVLTVA